ncbi:hypothetical protein DFA_02402 [Cavenderia fasciculata]|uniref:FNIP repeat-containing protein n=1 Tax=Cavenderia fasciculata TaxID=261658 RepID=F4PZC6_CACFS|nr:uncharacterized protein DFA_02402 [Cavenderia fasciculata]EGG19155.1 hypothetical protein DFA_02402 [Cavenderia fasciculata]|eukprot:XP_004366788.1 hypothetical protein DFA_02402 [Cavenderia fasciculata]
MFDKLSNLLIIQIITEIEDNVDLVCLLLTCKHFYHNSSLKRLIRFKVDVRVFDKGIVSDKFTTIVNRFNLNSFKDILDNSISNQHIIVPPNKNYPKWLKDRISANNTADTSCVTTVFLNYDESNSSKQLDSLYKIPSIETLFIHDLGENSVVDLTSISSLPNLQRLTVCAGELNLSPHTSLSLTKLTLSLSNIPPQNAFISLKSLVYLKMDLLEEDNDQEEHVMDSLCLDLSSLLNLETFKFREDGFDEFTDYDDDIINIILPPSLKIMSIFSKRTQIPSGNKYIMPVLEKLYVVQSLLIDEKISLSLTPSLKKLVIYQCDEPIPSNLIPSNLEKLTVYRYPGHKDTLGLVVFPPSLTHLSIKGDYLEPSVRLPQSLIKLNITTDYLTVTLPQHLKKLVWTIGSRSKKIYPNLELSSSNNYPLHLETLNFYNIVGHFTIKVPPVTKYLSIPLYSSTKIYSISSRITVTKPIDQQSQQQQLWLPHNTTHLTCYSKNRPNMVFRLDEVINHTNVGYLTIIVETKTFQFTIQRLDSDNRNVLVLEKQTLQGGIITQRKTLNNQQQQHQHYDPIYIYLDTYFEIQPNKNITISGGTCDLLESQKNKKPKQIHKATFQSFLLNTYK